MKQFNLYCTKEETLKAYKLGAPIEECKCLPMILKNDERLQELQADMFDVELPTDGRTDIIVYGKRPTIEQMVGWIRSLGFAKPMYEEGVKPFFDGYEETMHDVIGRNLDYIEYIKESIPAKRICVA